MKTILFALATMAAFNANAASFTSKAVKLNVETSLNIQAVNTTLRCWTDNLRGDGDAQSTESAQSKVSLAKTSKGYELNIPSQNVSYKSLMRSFQGCEVNLVGFVGYNKASRLPLDSEESLTLIREMSPESLDAGLKEVARITTLVSVGSNNGSLKVARQDK